MQQQQETRYYTDIAAAVRSSLTRVSQDDHLTNTTDHSPPTPGREDAPGWTAYTHLPQRNPNEHIRSYEPQPSLQAPWHGVELVDVATLAATLLIAFRWRETGGEVFVRLFDLRPHAEYGHPVALAETIITTNLLEQLGSGWHLHTSLQRIGGLTFIEAFTP